MAHTTKFTDALNHTPGHAHTTDQSTHTTQTDTILNLSKTFTLTQAQAGLLERGLTFVPQPRRVDGDELRRDIHHFHRRLRLLDYFHYTDTYTYTPFKPPSTWQPKTGTTHPRITHFINKNTHTYNTHTQSTTNTYNLTPAEQTAINQLANNKHIIIKPADKGSKIVIMDRHQYILECNRQLNNRQHYRKINHNIQLQTQTQLRHILDDLRRLNFITDRQRQYLYGPDNPRPRRFYLLPKIHKDPSTWTIPSEVPPGRPIVSDCGSESNSISEFIEHHLNPLSSRHPSYIKDTYHFLDRIRPMVVPSQSLLFTIDIDSLYTNIQTEDGLGAVREALTRYPDTSRPDSHILELLEICLTSNNFTFNNNQYLQIQGTAMGQRYAPSYANIYMAQWEREALTKCTHRPILYLRFLDDIIGVWTHGIGTFEHFIDILNNHHPTIKVKYSISPVQVDFLDTTVYFHTQGAQKTLRTKVFSKPTDTHALLHKHSFHPKHTFTGIIKSQIIRYTRISSTYAQLESSIRTLFQALGHRGYSKRFLRHIKNTTLASFFPAGPPHPDTDITYVLSTRTSGSPLPSHNTNPSTPYPNTDPPTSQSLQPTNTRIIPLIITYTHFARTLQHKIKLNYNNTQSLHPPLQRYRLITAYRKNKNLQDLLVRAALAPIRETPTTNTYNTHITQVKFIRNPHSNTQAPVHPTVHHTQGNVVYGITCRHCKKLYIGETKYTLTHRLKQHLYTIKKGSLRTPLVQHFQQHSPSHLTITALETCAAWSTAQRRSQERKWIRLLRTRVPYGLNARY